MKPDEATLKLVRSAPIFAGLSDTEWACVAHGEVVDFPVGTVLVEQGMKLPYFSVILEGEIRLIRQYDNQEILMAVVKPLNYLGEVTMLLDIASPSTARVGKAARMFKLSEDDFWRMLRQCPALAKVIFRSAASKMRNLEGYSQQREKLASLGTMAAGLAHELNNPAAAARRAAAHLRETTDKLQCSLCTLAKSLEHDHWQQLVDASEEAIERVDHAPVLDHLERSDRAEIIATWLQAHGVEMAWEVAPTFVSGGVDVAWLEKLTTRLPATSLVSSLDWLEARLNLKLLLLQVEQSTGRISELVKAMKDYSHMGQSPMQEVDIHDGLESTLTMLGHKLKNMTVVRDYDRTIPKLTAYPSELNQVWTNLIDNAIDAVQGTGKICIGTCHEDNQLVVEIVDNGAGIPAEVQAHMFEPFFTTKPVGSGTGLGLIISHRIVAARHGGEIEFESKPGETRFKVRLPLNRERPNGDSATQRANGV